MNKTGRFSLPWFSTAPEPVLSARVKRETSQTTATAATWAWLQHRTHVSSLWRHGLLTSTFSLHFQECSSCYLCPILCDTVCTPGKRSRRTHIVLCNVHSPNFLWPFPLRWGCRWAKWFFVPVSIPSSRLTVFYTPFLFELMLLPLRVVAGSSLLCSEHVSSDRSHSQEPNWKVINISGNTGDCWLFI